MKKLISILAVFLYSSIAWATACPTGYGYSKVFIIDPNVTPSTLTSFPIPLTFNGATLGLNGIQTNTSDTLPDLKASGSGGKILSAGDDIVFCDAYSSGNLLNFERVVWTSTTGLAEFYVSQTISSSAPTSIWMFYGKASDSDHSNAAAVWSAANYVYVNHFPNGSSLSVADSTGNTSPINHGATANSGFVAGGANFVSSSSQYVASGAALPSSSNITVEAWIKPTSGALGVCDYAISNMNLGTNDTSFLLSTYGCASSGKVYWQICEDSACSGQSYLVTQAGDVPAGVWTHFQMTAGPSISTSNFLMYLNGAHYTNFSVTQYSGSYVASPNNVTVGANTPGTNNFWDGGIDEVRISSVIESNDWMQANAAAQMNPSSFSVMVDASIPTGMSSGANCVPVIVNSSGVTASQSDFPLLVRGVYPWMAYVSNGGYAVNGNSGFDIRWFSDSACTAALVFQRVFYTSATGSSAWRVHVPSLSSSSNTTIYAKIGNPGDSSDLSTTWEGSYGNVGWYNGGSETSLVTADSGNANLDISESTVGTVTGAASILGGGFFANNIAGTNPFNSLGWDPALGDSIGAHGYPTGSAVMHQRVWFRAVGITLPPSTAVDDQNLVGFGKANGTGQNGLGILYFTDPPNPNGVVASGMNVAGLTTGDPAMAATSPAQTPTPSTPTFIQDYGWHLLDFDFPTSGGALSTASLYVDGVPITAPFCPSCSTVINTDNSPGLSGEAEIRMFRDAAHGVAGFTGYIAQWEVSNVSRSASYVATRYNNEYNPSTFYSFGTATHPIVTSTQNPFWSIP